MSLKCDVCGNWGNSLWASADARNEKIMVCSPCVEENLDIDYRKGSDD